MTDTIGVTRRELRLAAPPTARPPAGLPTPGGLQAPAVAPLPAAPTRRESGAGEQRPARAAGSLPVALRSVASLLRTTAPRPALTLAVRRSAASGVGRPTLGGLGLATSLRRIVAQPRYVAVLSACFVAGSIAQVVAEQDARDDYRAAVQVAAEAQAAHEVRISTAQSARMTEQAVAYAAQRRAEALAAAQAALAAADQVAATAATVVAPDQLGTLDSAADALATLVEATPAPLPAVEPARPAPRGAVVHDGRQAPSGQNQRAEATTALLASVRADDGGGRAVVPGRVPTGGVEAPADASIPAATPPTVEVAPVPEAAEALDLELTEQVVAAAEKVAALSAQVQATAEANIAAARAAAEAAAAEAARVEAAARAAEAARVERERLAALAADAENGRLPAELLCGVDFQRGVSLRCDAAQTLEQLNVAFRARFGRDLEVASAYRTYEEQVSVKASKGGLAAVPGTSNHGDGVAVDFEGFGSVGQFGLPTYLWMAANAGDYGWYHPSYMQAGGAGPLEPWHWEFGTAE